jgi:hypothetical protein
VLVGLLFWLWRRRQKRKAVVAETGVSAEPRIEIAKPELGGNAVVEILGRGLVPKNELGGNMVVEVDGAEDIRRAELEAREARI